jgi:hypothetical protein
MKLAGFEIYADTGNPVPSATVDVRDASSAQPNTSGILASTTTDAQGFWQFTSLPAGPKDIRITKDAKYRDYKGLSILPFVMPIYPRCKALQTGSLSVASNTYTPIPLAAADEWDTEAMHSTTVNNTRITIPAGGDGHYLITARTNALANGTGAGGTNELGRASLIRKNGVTYLTSVHTQAVLRAGDSTQHTLTVEAELSPADYLEVVVLQSSLAACSYDQTHLSVVKLGAK